MHQCYVTSSGPTRKAAYTGGVLYTVTPSLYAIADGKEFYTEAIAVAGEFATCNGEVIKPSSFDKILAVFSEKKLETPVSTPEALLAKLRGDAAAVVRDHLTPVSRKIRITFKDRDNDLAKPDQEQFRSAIAFARSGRLDRTCGIFETMMTPDKANSIPLLYNLGVCQEALEPDRPGLALEYYAKADQRTSKPDRMVSDAFQRAKAQVDAQRDTGKR